MLIDTHCHLQFSPLAERVDEVILRAKSAGVTRFIVPGTNAETSKLAVSLAEKYEGVYAAVGVHPEDVTTIFNSQFSIFNQISIINFQTEFKQIETLLSHPRVVAVGEVGLDQFYLRMTNDKSQITNETQNTNEQMIKLQKEVLVKQIQLAVQYKKALILHSREMAEEIIGVLTENWSENLKNRTVLHCCEASDNLFAFAKEKNIFLGVDGDISWSKKKQRFIKSVPLSLLVLETDSPYLVPLELKEKEKWNEPKNVAVVAERVAKFKDISVEEVEKVTSENAKKLFAI